MAGQFHYAQKRGYSGVGIYMHAEPSDVVVGLGDNEFDNEGDGSKRASISPGASSASSAATSPAGLRAKSVNRPSSASSPCSIRSCWPYGRSASSS
jgi:hypothetical protein